MEKLIKDFGESFRKRWAANDEDYSELTKQAQVIATTALSIFSGTLLEKALNISSAIVDFEDALKRSQ